MKPKLHITRRKLLQFSGLSSISLLLGGCGTPVFEGVIGALSEPLNENFQSLLLKPQTPVPEFSPNEIEPDKLIVNSYRFTPVINQEKFRLIIDGEVENPITLSMDDIKNLSYTSTIIRHVCVEGWAAIVQWGGIRLRELVAIAQPKSSVKYAYFQSADGYYSSWDIASTLHPQTLLAYEKNGEPLPVDNGAPLRLASPIKLGYKQSKWVTRVTLVSNLFSRQGYWEDQGYEWFAGL